MRILPIVVAGAFGVWWSPQALARGDLGAGLQGLPPTASPEGIVPTIAEPPAMETPVAPQTATPEARLTSLRIAAIEAQIAALTAEVELLRAGNPP